MKCEHGIFVTCAASPPRYDFVIVVRGRNLLYACPGVVLLAYLPVHRTICNGSVVCRAWPSGSEGNVPFEQTDLISSDLVDGLRLLIFRKLFDERQHENRKGDEM